MIIGISKKQKQMKIKLVSLGLLTLSACIAYTGLVLMPDPSGAPITQPKPQTAPKSATDKLVAVQDQNNITSAQTAASSSLDAVNNPADAHSDAAAPVRPEKSPVVSIDNQSYPRRRYQPLTIPNDPSAGQWWVTQTNLDQAWDIPIGTAETVLAIIDGGYALQHEEFANRWYENSAEKGATTNEAASSLNCTDRSLALSASCNLIDDDNDGIVDEESGAVTYENPSRLNCTAQVRALDKSCNRIDDDGNGYIDDVRGWDFINYDNAPQAGELNPSGTGTTHGTRVAGVAAATGNNTVGIAGVDWQTKILPIQALDDDSYGDTLSVGRSIYYAIERGADVISISLGSDLPDDYVRGAVQAALAEGIVVVAASGNDGCDCMVYPANYPETLAVGALNSSSQPASFSSYGVNLDILAPGTSMTSATWQSGNQVSAYATNIAGTSFSTPMVGGMLTRLKSVRPTATPTQLIAALTENVNRLGMAAATPRDNQKGFGTLDALKATGRMASPKSGPIMYALTPVSMGKVLYGGSAIEPTGNAFLYICEGDSTGSTAIYELNKGASHFFSSSKIENQDARDAGYTSNLFAYGCVRQPHDGQSVMRGLNIFHEFRDLYPKY